MTPMRVDLTTEAFTEADALTNLLALMRCFADGRHDWVASDAVLAAAERYLSEHAPRLAAVLLDLGRKGAVATLWGGPSGLGQLVQVSGSDLPDYTADLCRPATLVVEDQDSDGCFIRAIARVFAADRVELALANGWLEICHGGGGSAVKVAEAAAGRYRRVPLVSALLDSDRMVPGQRTAAHDKADRLRMLGIAVHVLEFREAENYVPNRVLRGVGRAREASRRLELLRQLTLRQRAYLDMKVGFGPVNQPPRVHPAQQDLFRDVHQQVLIGLRGGFGNDLLRQMADTSESLTEQDFASLGDGVAAELRSMLLTVSSVI
jgi:hypothetical protein